MICLFQSCHFGNHNVYLTIPGSEIPNWFKHQNVGASVNLQVPSHLLSSGKFVAIATCAIYIFREHHPLDQLVWYYKGHQFEPWLWCRFNVNGCELPCDCVSLLTEEFGKVESYHLLLRCYSFTSLESRWKEKFYANEFTQIVVTFESDNPSVEITKCGVHLIFEQDIEDFKQTKPGSSSCTITPYYEDDDLGNSEKDTKIKESGDDEPPHLKWTEHPNLIENWFGNLCTQGQGDSDCEESQ